MHYENSNKNLRNKGHGSMIDTVSIGIIAGTFTGIALVIYALKSRPTNSVQEDNSGNYTDLIDSPYKRLIDFFHPIKIIRKALGIDNTNQNGQWLDPVSDTHKCNPPKFKNALKTVSVADRTWVCICGGMWKYVQTGGKIRKTYTTYAVIELKQPTPKKSPTTKSKTVDEKRESTFDEFNGFEEFDKTGRRITPQAPELKHSNKKRNVTLNSRQLMRENIGLKI